MTASAQELADAIEARIKAGQHVFLHIEQARWVATLLRRISDTERERDDLRASVSATELSARSVVKRSDYWQERAETAEAERDRLREMLAQADAVLAALDRADISGRSLTVTEADHWQEAVKRHRLSQKDAGSTKEGE